MVRKIELAIPPGMEAVYNPTEDTALMAQIGAERTSSLFVGEKDVGSAYELENAETGMTSQLWWWSSTNSQHYYCRIKRIE